MEEKIPSMQESFRKSGFPRLSHRKIETATQSQDGKTEIEIRKQWEFSDKESSSSIIVDTDFLVYQVTHYSQFENYIDTLKQVLEIFCYHAEPSLISRIGLRYIDLVKPTEEKSLESYFSNSLRGFKVKHADSREALMTESVSKTGENSKFIHRYVEAQKGLGFPPDLLPLNLKFNRELRMDNEFGMLDMDHFVTLNEEFDIPATIEHLWKLHEYQTDAFTASVTEEALMEWRKE
jgi:uncharacterized protein (TIGR04255 family)